MPNNALTRKDPPKGKKGFSTNKGFTVIELMITIAVIAIVTSLALPSYRSIVEKRQVTSGAEQVMAFLSTAQMEAVKRNQFVAVNYQDNGGAWCFGLTAADDDDASCDCTNNSCTLDGQLRVLNSTMLKRPQVLSAATVGGDDDTLVFDPVRGLTVGAEVADIALISPDATSWALNIQITPTGRVKICTDSGRGDHPVPGYEECP